MIIVTTPQARIYTVILQNKSKTWEKFAYEGADTALSNEAGKWNDREITNGYYADGEARSAD